MSHLPSKALGPTVYERLSFMFYYFSKIGAADRASKEASFYHLGLRIAEL